MNRHLRWLARVVLGAAVVVCTPGAPRPAVAQPAVLEASKKAAAAAADKAFEAFKQGKFVEALAGFEEADKAFHSPKFLLYVARTQAKLGRLLAAKATYAKVIAEPLAAYAPAEFFAAQSDAKTELVALVRRIPYVSVHAAAGVGSLALDGQPVSEGSKIAVDPGDHTLSGQTAAGASLQSKVRVAEGESKEVTLETSVAPPATVPELAPPATPRDLLRRRTQPRRRVSPAPSAAFRRRLSSRMAVRRRGS